MENHCLQERRVAGGWAKADVAAKLGTFVQLWRAHFPRTPLVPASAGAQMDGEAGGMVLE